MGNHQDACREDASWRFGVSRQPRHRDTIVLVGAVGASDVFVFVPCGVPSLTLGASDVFFSTGVYERVRDGVARHACSVLPRHVRTIADNVYVSQVAPSAPLHPGLLFRTPVQGIPQPVHVMSVS